MKHPIKKILKIKVSCKIQEEHLKKLGIITPYIYTGMDKVSDYLKKHFSEN
jgi:hypothetical protein